MVQVLEHSSSSTKEGFENRFVMFGTRTFRIFSDFVLVFGYHLQSDCQKNGSQAAEGILSDHLQSDFQKKGSQSAKRIAGCDTNLRYKHRYKMFCSILNKPIFNSFVGKGNNSCTLALSYLHAHHH